MRKLFLYMFLGLLWCNFAIADTSKYKPWIYNDIKISEKCLQHLYPLASGDWYETYYNEYIEKIDEHWGNPKFELFVSRIGGYLGNEIPLGHKFESSWGETMSLTRYLKDCNKGNEFEYIVKAELDNFYCNDFAPHIKHKCSSIVLIRHFSETRVKLFGMTVYGLYNINGEMIILPLRNLR